MKKAMDLVRVLVKVTFLGYDEKMLFFILLSNSLFIYCSNTLGILPAVALSKSSSLLKNSLYKSLEFIDFHSLK